MDKSDFNISNFYIEALPLYLQAVYYRTSLYAPNHKSTLYIRNNFKFGDFMNSEVLIIFHVIQ